MKFQIKSTSIYIFIFLLLRKISLFADDEYAKPTLQYDDVDYRNSIRTVLLHPATIEFGFPIIKLNSTDKLRLEFDDLDADVKSFNYTLIHCDFGWKPTEIGVGQYISGSLNESITAYSQSFNATPQYTHYALNFPTSMVVPTKSGNYIIKIWEDDAEENLVLTRRFIIYEPIVFIEGNVHGATLNADRNYKQEVDFNVNLPDNFALQNAYTDINVAIVQNQCWETAITNLQPLYVKQNQLTYDYDDGNVFNGNNEFRNFDIKNLRASVNISINKIEYDAQKQTHVYLVTDEKRAFKKYTLFTDLDGRFAIRTSNGTNAAIDADYAFVHFNLMAEDSVTEGALYVYGAFSNYKCLPANKMKYNAEYKRYLATVQLKQGYYEYAYAYQKQTETTPNLTLIEGNRFETENEYAVFIYQRGIGVFYDKCIGVQFFKPNASSR